MDRVPLELVIRHASRTIGDFFAEKVEAERKNGKVAILVEDFTNSLYFMPCDVQGYPNYHYFNYMTFDSLSLQALNIGQLPPTTTMTVKEVSIMIEKPMLSQRFDWQERPYVFMWFGRKMSSKDIPLEKIKRVRTYEIGTKSGDRQRRACNRRSLKNKIYK